MKTHKGPYVTSQGIKWNGSSYFRKRDKTWRDTLTGRVAKSPTREAILRSKRVEPEYGHFHGGDMRAREIRSSQHLAERERHAFERLKKE